MAREYPMATFRGKKKNIRILFRVGHGIPSAKWASKFRETAQRDSSLTIRARPWLPSRQTFLHPPTTCGETAKSAWALRNMSRLVATKNQSSVTPKYLVRPRQRKETGEPSEAMCMVVPLRSRPRVNGFPSSPNSRRDGLRS